MDKINQDKNNQPFYLIIGDEFIAENEAKSIAKKLSGDSDNDLGMFFYDGTVCDYQELNQELNTYSLFGGTKIIILSNVVMKKEKYDQENILKLIESAYEKNNKKKASSLLWIMLKEEFPKNSTFEDIRKTSIEQFIKQKGETIVQIYQYILSNKIKPPEREENVLLNMIEKGIPSRHYLIITTSSIASSHPLFLAMQKKGIIIDKESDDKKNNSALYQEIIKKVFPHFENQKEAYQTFNQLVGDNFRLYSNELQKLATFAGEKGIISKKDVLDLVSNYRDLEFFEFSQSLGEKNLKKSLELFEKEYESGKHPLQILAIFTSTVRQLILDIYIFENIFTKKPKSFPTYKQFEDQYLSQAVKCLENLGNKKAHPFALYKRLERAKSFRMETLMIVVKKVFDFDRILKSSAMAQKILLETLIFDICRV